jgi:hypothetical protein
MRCGGCSVIRRLCSFIEDAGDLGQVVRANRARPPDVSVHSEARHFESWEAVIEEEPYEVEITRDVLDASQPSGRRREHVGWETHWRHVRTHHSSWVRCDAGGGHFSGRPSLLSAANRLGPVRTETMSSSTFTKHAVFPYASWEEAGPPVELPDVALLETTFTVSVELDDETRAAVEHLRRDLQEEAATYDTAAAARVQVEVPGFVSSVVGAIDLAEFQRIRTFYSASIGQALWFVCWLFGFHPIFECFAQYSTARTVVECVKLVSMRPSLRARPGAPDDAAAALAFPQRTATPKAPPESQESLSGVPLLHGAMLTNPYDGSV